LAGLFVIVLVLTVGGVRVEAQQAGKIYRVGYLGGGSGVSASMRSVQRELRTLGYVEGKNIVFEYRRAEDKPERTPLLAEELVRLKVDLIVAGGDGDTIPAKNATQTIPIVFWSPWVILLRLAWLPAWRGREVTLPVLPPSRVYWPVNVWSY
jgi:ABC-type uncharacterized transport system substrate-binding protein